MSHGVYGMGDRDMQVTRALATGTSYSDPMELTESPMTQNGVDIAPYDLRIGVPALTATELPANSSVTFSLQYSNDPDFTSADGIREITDSQAKITGSADGSEAEYFHFRSPYKHGRFVRVKTVGTAVGSTSKEYVLDYMV